MATFRNRGTFQCQRRSFSRNPEIRTDFSDRSDAWPQLADPIQQGYWWAASVDSVGEI